MKILAMDTFQPGVTLDDVSPHLLEEMKESWKLYMDGFIREWYFRGDQQGAVLILEADSIDDAKMKMNSLPLVRENLISFTYIPLHPFMVLSALFEKSN
ncbi:hypothetical protein [Methanospirillum hungatei]|uniref:hypothetical protein n=1 Tax=Methanospirillum hungatei TaxID=2203 RepID=UPI0026EEAD97|nr:hypothetical protein [Methanospirillum hungatei]MCA1916456.1 hypothetical protein [Methanospirillum hungatei]